MTEPCYAAIFRTVADAKRFYERQLEEGAWKKNLVQNGRQVTWDADIPEPYDAIVSPHQYFLDCLEQVGYYGSSTRFRAKLNGVPAPIAY